MSRPKPLSSAGAKQLVIRVDRQMHLALIADAERNGRTITQSVRFHVQRSLSNNSEESPT